MPDNPTTAAPTPLSQITAPAPTIVAVALGSNLGDRRANIESAVAQFSTLPATAILALSHLWENPAVGGPPDAPPFLNAAATLSTTLDPAELLTRLLEIEKTLGRTPHAKWAPRPIDLDLLLYGNRIIQTPTLVVPHPLMHQRRFVLLPLSEIAPDAMHPVLHRTIADLLASLVHPPD